MSHNHLPPDPFRRRPEIESYPPRLILSAAQDLENYYLGKEGVNKYVASHEAARQLNVHLESQFTSAPAVEVQAHAVYWAKEDITNSGTGARTYTPKPYQPSLEDQTYGSIKLEGSLLGFHGVSQTDGVSHGPAVYAHVGIAQPERHIGYMTISVLSVPVSEIISMTLVREQEQELIEHLRSLTNDCPIKDYEVYQSSIDNISKALDNSHLGYLERLQELNQYASAIFRLNSGRGIDDRIMNTICELVRRNMKLDRRMTIRSRTYRDITGLPKPGFYIPRKEGVFSGVKPQVGPIGESASSQLGLYFHHDVDNQKKAIGVPVDSIWQITPWHR